MDDQAPRKIMATELSDDFARILRARRESMGWTLQRLSLRTGGRLDAVAIEAIEAGETVIDDRSLVATIAAAYEVDLALLYRPREAVQVGDTEVVSGHVRVGFAHRHVDEVLVAYLEVLRLVRGASEAPVVSFRRVDINALSAALDYPGEAIVGRLAILIGAASRVHASLVRRYEEGAVLISVALPGADVDHVAGWHDRVVTGPLRHVGPAH